VTLANFVRGLPGRFDELTACGFQDSLVHGDFHPGDFRSDGRALTLLDWGDSGIGASLAGQPAFLSAIPNDAAGAARAHWLQQWSEAIPIPTLLAPRFCLLRSLPRGRRSFIGAFSTTSNLRSTLHRADPAKWLKRTAALGLK